MFNDEVPRKLVIRSAREHELHFVALGECVQIREVKLPPSPDPGHFTSTILCTAFGTFARGRSPLVSIISVYPSRSSRCISGQKFLLLQHGLATRKLNQLYRGKLFNFRCHLVFSELVAAAEGVLGVAPAAAQVASRQPHKDARQPGEAGFALNGFIDFDEIHFCVYS